jgi:hypothetical protein
MAIPFNGAADSFFAAIVGYPESRRQFAGTPGLPGALSRMFG